MQRLSDEMSTSSMTVDSFSFSMAFLLTSISFTAGEEEGPATEEECVPFFFTATDEAGIAFCFLNPIGRLMGFVISKGGGGYGSGE